ncbi:ABC transporter permease [Nocardioides marmotae]|uniref:ABC transporter permease n=1 Tax=Nocardioides marmotae TaxID=2663857 RepID=UPI0012B55021|nr:ABC transporter permease [Nocardioides marmotae]MBC9732450.1 ABC transporter permease [Nocardioides marmotae]MTB83569.1 ABC transporter permease [Nocardioides marmotae]
MTTTTLSPTRVLGLARANTTLVLRNRLTLIYAVVLPLAPLLLLLVGDSGSEASGAGAAAIITALMMAALFPVFYNLLSQLVTRRDELVLKRLRTGESTDAEIIVSLALPGFVIALATAVVAVPVAMLLGQDAPLNPLLYAASVVLTLLLFAAFALWTAAWTRNAEAAQITSMPVIVLAVLGQVAIGFPEEVRRWTDLTPGAAMTDLVRVTWFGMETGSTERTLDFAGTWAPAGQPLLVLVAWTALAVYLARRSMRWEPRS